MDEEGYKDIKSPLLKFSTVNDVSRDLLPEVSCRSGIDELRV